MIIPLSHDTGRLHRAPVVTWALMAACALVFLMTTGLGDPVLDEAESRFGEARDYWQEHPYLEPPDRLVERYGDLGAPARAEFAAAVERGEAPVDPRTLARKQATLEARVADVDAVLQRHVWFDHGLIPATPTRVGLFGHLFLHAGWLHLLGNLWFLFLCGPLVEDRLGRGLFALFYLACGFAGAALFVHRMPGFEGPLIGASGAIAGAMGAFLVRAWRTQIRFGYWLGFFFGTFRVPALLVLPLWFANELISARLVELAGGGGGVAYWAHVGGFGFGAGVAALAVAIGAERRVPEVPTTIDVPNDEEAMREELAPETEPDQGLEARATLRPGEAIDLAPEGAKQATLDAPLARAIAAGRRDDAVMRFRDCCERDPAPSLDAESALRLFPWLRAAGQAGLASAALWAALRHVSQGHADGPALLLRIARAARGFDPVVALRTARRALAEPAVPDDERPRLESLLREAEEATEGRGIIVLDDAQDLAVARRAEAPRAEVAAAPPEADSLFASGFTEPDDPQALDLAGPDRTEPGTAEASEPELELDDDALAAALASDEPAAAAAPDPNRETVTQTFEPAAPPEPFEPAERAARVTGPLDCDEEKEAPPEPALPLRSLRVLEARPVSLDGEALWLDVEGRGRTRLPLARIDGIALAGVRGLAKPGAVDSEGRPRAVLLLDLAMNATADTSEALVVVRLRSDRFDPRRLLAEASEGGSPLVALRQVVAGLLAGSRARPLCPAAASPEEALAVHGDLATYTQRVLGAQAATAEAH